MARVAGAYLHFLLVLECHPGWHLSERHPQPLSPRHQPQLHTAPEPQLVGICYSPSSPVHCTGHEACLHLMLRLPYEAHAKVLTNPGCYLCHVLLTADWCQSCKLGK